MPIDYVKEAFNAAFGLAGGPRLIPNQFTYKSGKPPVDISAKEFQAMVHKIVDDNKAAYMAADAKERVDIHVKLYKLYDETNNATMGGEYRYALQILNDAKWRSSKQKVPATPAEYEERTKVFIKEVKTEKEARDAAPKTTFDVTHNTAAVAYNELLGLDANKHRSIGQYKGKDHYNATFHKKVEALYDANVGQYRSGPADRQKMMVSLYREFQKNNDNHETSAVIASTMDIFLRAEILEKAQIAAKKKGDRTVSVDVIAGNDAMNDKAVNAAYWALHDASEAQKKSDEKSATPPAPTTSTGRTGRRKKQPTTATPPAANQPVAPTPADDDDKKVAAPNKGNSKVWPGRTTTTPPLAAGEPLNDDGLITYVSGNSKLGINYLWRGSHGVSGEDLNKKYGDLIQELQRSLDRVEGRTDVGSDDGVYGRGTEKRVRALQAKYGLAQDGVAGRQTVTALQVEELARVVTAKDAAAIELEAADVDALLSAGKNIPAKIKAEIKTLVEQIETDIKPAANSDLATVVASIKEKAGLSK